jgi:hypothetical protein
MLFHSMMAIPGSKPSKDQSHSHVFLQEGTNPYFSFNPLSAKLNLICHMLALLGAHPIFPVSRIRVKGIRRY